MTKNGNYTLENAVRKDADSSSYFIQTCTVFNKFSKHLYNFLKYLVED